MKHYKVLFLAMSCNDPFFEMSRKVVHDTWAKKLIEGRVSDCGFYSYTSSTNGKNYIEDNCIYVNCGDDINHTYGKTIKAMKYLKEQGITWDCIVRTNISTYINVEKTLELVNKTKNYYTGFFSRNEDILFAFGLYMFLPKELTDLLIENFDEYRDYDEQNNFVVNEYIYKLFTQLHVGGFYDDSLIGAYYMLLCKKYNKTPMYFILNNDAYVQHYKSFINNPFIQNQNERKGIYAYNQHNDPNVINIYPAMQVRLPGVLPKYRYIELEHMYELYNAEINK